MRFPNLVRARGFRWFPIVAALAVAGCGGRAEFGVQHHANGATVTVNGQRFELTEKVKDEFTDRVQTSPSPRIVVDTFAGKVVVVAGADNAVECKVEREAHGQTIAEAREFLDDIKIGWTHEGDAVKLTVRNLAQESLDTSNEGMLRKLAMRSAAISLKAPVGANLEVANRFGDLEVTGLAGHLAVDSKSGAILSKEGSGSMKLVSKFGKIDVTGKNTKVAVDAASGDIQVLGATGPIDVVGQFGNVLVRGANEKVTVKTASGTVTVEDSHAPVHLTSGFGAIAVETCKEAQIAATSGGVKIRGATGPVDVRAEFGAVAVDGAPAGVKVHSKSGDISVSNASGRVELSTGFGPVAAEVVEAHVRCKTQSGNVRVKGTLVDASHLLESGFGNVTIDLPANAQFAVDANTGFGKIASDFDMTPPLKGDATRHRGEVGGKPAANIQMKTQSGNIEIRSSG